MNRKASFGATAKKIGKKVVLDEEIEVTSLQAELKANYNLFHHSVRMTKHTRPMKDFLSKDGTIMRINVKYKPKKIAVYIVENNESVNFIVPGQDGAAFLMSEEQFYETFDLDY